MKFSISFFVISFVSLFLFSFFFFVYVALLIDNLNSFKIKSYKYLISFILFFGLCFMLLKSKSDKK